MELIKIMPCLDMKNGRVVKGVHFLDLKEADDPVENAVFYQAEGADELAMLDIAATRENRKTHLEWVKNVAAVLSIPLTVGGGIASIEDIELVLEAGASKVSMNSAAVKNPELVRQAAQKFGAMGRQICNLETRWSLYQGEQRASGGQWRKLFLQKAPPLQ